MKIAVMGAGAIGGYFGARLAASGQDVHFIARGAHLEAMQRNGLTIYSPLGDLKLDRVQATNDPAAVGPADIILFCVKLWDLEIATAQIKPMIGPDTAVYSFQNGIYAEPKLVELLGAQHVIGGYAATPATLIEPGVVRQFGKWAQLEFGELDNRRTRRVESFLDACQKSDIDAGISEDIEAALWRKFVFITTHSGATSLCRAPEGPIRSDEWGRRLLTGLATEGTQVARAKKVSIPADYPDYILHQIDELPADAQGSMYTDLQRKARLELEWLNGLMVRLGREVGVPTPCHEAVMMGVQLHAGGAA